MGLSGELDLIRNIRARAGSATLTAKSAARPTPLPGNLRLGIGDDCAVLRPLAGHDVLLTTDFSLEGRHFRRDWHSAASAGHRCLARGLSDIAAMGGVPMAAFLSLALPSGTLRRATGRKWVDGFLNGLLSLASETGTPLAGGDTSTAPGNAVLADIVLLGSVPRGKELRRSTARAGDVLYVTGSLGGAAAELAALSKKPGRFSSAVASEAHPHLFPQPRLTVGLRLRGIATAAIDVSDGLSSDLQHLCDESGLGAVIDASALPLHPLIATLPQDQAEQLALHGGEDYELLFTASPLRKLPRRIGGVPVTRIGAMTAKRGISLRRNGSATPLTPRGWEHAL